MKVRTLMPLAWQAHMMRTIQRARYWRFFLLAAGVRRHQAAFHDLLGFTW